jgi:hypothetical protein
MEKKITKPAATKHPPNRPTNPPQPHAPDRPAVDLAQAREQLAQRAHGAALREEALLRPGAEEELAVEVGFREAVKGGVQLGRGRARLEAERVECGRVVAADLGGLGVVRRRQCQGAGLEV